MTQMLELSSKDFKVDIKKCLSNQLKFPLDQMKKWKISAKKNKR